MFYHVWVWLSLGFTLRSANLCNVPDSCMYNDIVDSLCTLMHPRPMLDMLWINYNKSCFLQWYLAPFKLHGNTKPQLSKSKPVMAFWMQEAKVKALAFMGLSGLDICSITLWLTWEFREKNLSCFIRCPLGSDFINPLILRVIIHNKFLHKTMDSVNTITIRNTRRCKLIHFNCFD